MKELHILAVEETTIVTRMFVFSCLGFCWGLVHAYRRQLFSDFANTMYDTTLLLAYAWLTRLLLQKKQS